MHKQSTILAVAFVASIATSFWLWRLLGAERERADDLQARVVRFESLRAASTPERPAGPAISSTPLPAGTGDTKVAAKPEHDEQRLMADDWTEYERRLLQNPKYREAWRAKRRLELASGHGDLAAVLQISQESADQLMDLLVDRELRYLDKPHPNPANEEELVVRKLEIKEAELALDTELVALLGEAKLANWKEYQASLPTRHQVLQLRAALSTSAEPLREDQMEPLISVMYTEQKQLKAELADFTATLAWTDGMEEQSHLRRNERHAELAIAANKRIHAAAASILSKQQLARLDGMQKREFDMQDTHFRMQRAMSDMSARGKLNVSESN